MSEDPKNQQSTAPGSATGFSRRAVTTAMSAAAGAGAISVLGACSGVLPQGETAAPAQLRKGANIVWAVDEGPTRTPVRQDQVKLFKERFPDINFEFLLGATGEEKLQSLFAAGTPPDLFRQEAPIMAYLATRGKLVALDPLIRRDKYDLSDFFPNIWEHWSWKGKFYGVPFLGVQIAYYNRSGRGRRRRETRSGRPSTRSSHCSTRRPSRVRRYSTMRLTPTGRFPIVRAGQHPRPAALEKLAVLAETAHAFAAEDALP